MAVSLEMSQQAKVVQVTQGGTALLMHFLNVCLVRCIHSKWINSAINLDLFAKDWRPIFLLLVSKKAILFGSLEKLTERSMSLSVSRVLAVSVTRE